MTFRIGILGGGNISYTHARAAREIKGVEIVAVCGQNQEKVERLAKECGAIACRDLESFLTLKPMEVALIGSPSGLHAEHGIRAARNGLHALVEKPVTITTEQADALVAECDEAKVKLGVFFQDRFAPDILKLKALIDGGALGKPFLVSAQVKWYRPPDYYKGSRWRGTWALDGGGALMNQGVHTVDLLLWLMGDVRRVSGKAITAMHDIEVEDTAVATLEFSNGAIGTLEAATSAFPGYPRRIEVTGSEGTIILEGDRITSADLRSPLLESVGHQATGDDERSRSHMISDASGHRRVIEDFLHAIATDGSPLCDGHQARRSVAVIQAIYESSRTGQSVSLATNR
ncbi:MAG TPA: Gfo/Idh/MocA family oxidoreductase [Blastocatellia bacterium]|nr:Gfo/Idh/MocA family oxidoreductase [Blastocatellia bacterium]